MAALLAVASTAAGQEPAGPELRVNHYTTGLQELPAVSADRDGRFVMVWSSTAQDGSEEGIFGRLLSPAGEPYGAEFQVNDYTTGSQHRPAVAAWPHGDFVVVWQGVGPGTSAGTFARRFDATGTALDSTDLRVDGSPFDDSRPSVATQPFSRFVVAWQAGDTRIAVRRFQFGTIDSPERMANDSTTVVLAAPSVAAAPSGDFVVTWERDPDSPGVDVAARQHWSDTIRRGDEFMVHEHTTGAQREPAVAFDATGHFTVVWSDDGLGTIMVRRFDGSGTPTALPLPVSQSYAGGRHPAVAADATGSAAVAWEVAAGATDSIVAGNVLDPTGAALPSDLSIGSSAAPAPITPALGRARNGNFLVAWTREDATGSSDIHARLYGDRIFRDGFE